MKVEKLYGENHQENKKMKTKHDGSLLMFHQGEQVQKNGSPKTDEHRAELRDEKTTWKRHQPQHDHAANRNDALDKVNPGFHRSVFHL